MALLHACLGQEVGSYFLETLTLEYQKYYKSNKSKEANNLLLMIAHLYNLHVIYCGFIYDIFKSLVLSFKEIDIELLLLLLKATGFQLRSDDPSALKEIIILVQQQAIKYNITLDKDNSDKNKEIKNNNNNNNEDDEEKQGFTLRAKFMIQTIYDLKNNKQRGNNDDSSLIIQLKKQVRNIMNKQEKGEINTLRITYEDVINVNIRGRWWIVGSAWSGKGPSLLNSTNDSINTTTNNNNNKEENKIMELAKVHHMNTETKRGIFYSIMTSDDFIDAYEKISKLNLKGKQEREIINVIIYCALQEKQFNEYYGHLACKFCSTSHQFRFSFQTAIWDKLKTLGDNNNNNIRSISNLAHLIVRLIASNSLSLSIFKVVDFTQLNTYSIVFFRLVFTTLFSKYNEDIIDSVFQRLSVNNDGPIILLKEGICHFFLQEQLHHANKMNNNNGNNNEQQTIIFKRMKAVKKMLEKSIQEATLFQ